MMPFLKTVSFPLCKYFCNTLEVNFTVNLIYLFILEPSDNDFDEDISEKEREHYKHKFKGKYCY